ncbi:MAG: hypothetical protein KGH71_00375 [Candidatus Micrarchaeota archaeon]|nr:hypothetical protein [Candidatus Micrarchaeota archaeon]
MAKKTFGGTVDRNPEIKELAKRRVFIFAAFFMLFALGGLIGEEGDILSHAADDIVLAGIAAVTIIYLYASRNRQSLVDLRRQHNIVLVLFIIALVVQIGAIFIEMGDPMDFGNEIPSLILIVLVLVNRFI